MAKLKSVFTVAKYSLTSFYGAYRLAKNQKDSKYLYYITDAQDSLDEFYGERYPGIQSFDTAEMEALWKERYFPPPYDLNALEKLPPNTLGYVYASHMKHHHLTPDFYIQYRKMDDEGIRKFFNQKIRYIRFRISQTHDVWHVLTGFDISSLGEAGLQGFYFGQFHSGFSVFIYLISLLASLAARQYDSLEKALELFYKGYVSGKHAKFILPVKWEEHWAEDIDDVRRQYNITPIVYDAAEAARLSERRQSMLA